MLPPDLKTKLAREAYNEAVKAARQNPTPSAWARLLRAARNLRDALVDFGASGAQPNEC